MVQHAGKRYETFVGRDHDRTPMLPLDQGPLSRRGWLAGQSAAFRRGVLDQGHWRHFSAGEVIALEGDTDTTIFGIGAGAIDAQRSHRHALPILGSILFPGQWFGSGPRLVQMPRMMTFTARLNSTLLCLGDAELKRVSAMFPDLPVHLAQLAQLQANHAVDCVSELLIPETELRITAVMMRLAKLAAPEPMLPLAQTELAEMANASRASVAKLVRELKQRGLVSVSYGRIIVCDRAGLTAWFDCRMVAD